MNGAVCGEAFRDRPVLESGPMRRRDRRFTKRWARSRKYHVVLLFGSLVCSGSAAAHGLDAVDPRDVGLPWYWLAFGFGAQALFMSRFVIQWWASERKRSSVVPVAFWWLSLGGGAALLVYFLRRGDPVGVAGQSFGILVYLRNLYFIHRPRLAGWAGGPGSWP